MDDDDFRARRTGAHAHAARHSATRLSIRYATLLACRRKMAYSAAAAPPAAEAAAMGCCHAHTLLPQCAYRLKVEGNAASMIDIAAAK